MPNLEVDLDSRAVAKSQEEFTLDSLARALKTLNQRGVPGDAKLTVNGPTRDTSGWAVIAKWDPEGRRSV